MFRLASTKVTTPVNESAQVLFAERSRCARISATVVNAGLPALHGQTMFDRITIIVRKRSISIIVVPIYPFLAWIRVAAASHATFADEVHGSMKIPGICRGRSNNSDLRALAMAMRPK